MQGRRGTLVRGAEGWEKRKRPIVKSVERAALILWELLGAEREGKRVAELSKELGLHKTTVVRLLQTLMAVGLVKKDTDSGRYYWEPLAWVAALSQVEGLLSRAEAVQGVLRELAEAIGETTFMARLHMKQRDVMVAVVAHPADPGHLHAAVGDRFPAHASAAGKVCLAGLSEAELERWMAGEMYAATERTITSPERLRTELERCRSNGYALNRGETALGLGAVAVPLLDRNEKTMGAVAITMPLPRLRKEKIPEWVAVLEDSAQKLARLL